MGEWAEVKEGGHSTRVAGSLSTPCGFLFFNPLVWQTSTRTLATAAKTAFVPMSQFDQQSPVNYNAIAERLAVVRKR